MYVYILVGEGNSSIFNSRFRCLSKYAYKSRTQALENVEDFKKKMCNPELGIDHAVDDDDLKVFIRHLELK